MLRRNLFLMTALAACILLAALPSFAIDEIAEVNTGSIAIITDDYNVDVLDFSSQERVALTSDGSTNRRYQWPTWSNDGRLAYFCCDLRFANDLTTEAYISSDAQTPGIVTFSNEALPIIYASWSPTNCEAGSNCRDLAMLVNNVRAGGLSVEMARQVNDEIEIRSIGDGSPFYYHWSNAGDQLIFHRNNDRVEIYDVATEDITRSFDDVKTGIFQTPVWSPVDNRLLFSVRNSAGENSLVIYENGTTRELEADLEGLVSFLWSPDGQSIAYRTIDSQEVSQMTVLSAETGEQILQTPMDNVISFFWSPDGQKIAYITLAESESFTTKNGDFARRISVQAGVPSFAWHVINIETGMNTRYSTFSPTYETGYLMQYFDQFAPSHRIWSPDSRYIVYSGVENDESSIFVLDTEGDERESTYLGSGVFGVWSFK